MQIAGNHSIPFITQPPRASEPIGVPDEAPRTVSVVRENTAVNQARSAVSPVTTEVQAALLAAQEAGVPEKQADTRALTTNKGNVNADLDALFSDVPPTTGKRLLSDLPPLLFPTAENIEAITEHVSARFQEMLAQYGIPSAPSEITYDQEGRMRLPADYPYAEELKAALDENPGLARELSTLSAMSSQFAELQKRVPFHEEYEQASTKAEAEQIVRKYSHLFQDTQSYSRIALVFSDSGELAVTADGKSIPSLSAA